MDVKDYLLIYKENGPKAWDEGVALETLGTSIVEEMNRHGSIDEQRSLEFINRTEKWKSMGIQERIIGAGRNTSEDARKALEGAISQSTDKLQIESLHALIGFGTSPHPEYRTRPAKVASVAMRFLFPYKWGVVDWRSGAIVNCLSESRDIEEAKVKALEKERSHWVDSFSHIDSDWAISLNQQYRKIGNRFDIEKNSVVDQFLFAISLQLWPLPAEKC
jgi:hypothetical protein